MQASHDASEQKRRRSVREPWIGTEDVHQVTAEPIEAVKHERFRRGTRRLLDDEPLLDRQRPRAGAAYPASVSPVTGPAGSHAFDSVAFNHVPLDLSAVGFYEQEYFLSGLANAYQYINPANSADDRVVPVQAQPVPYVNRILVRAPRDPARFSGNVILELGDDIAGSEDEVEWVHAHRQFLVNGDAYVTLTSLPEGVATLQTFNPVRYAALSWPTVAATQSACNDGPEPGINYDQITSLRSLLKQNKSDGPLPGLQVKRVFITGCSGGALTLLAYDRVFGLNSRLFDGYFFDAGATRRGINGCESLAAAAVRTEPPASTVSPVFQTHRVRHRVLLVPRRGALQGAG